MNGEENETQDKIEQPGAHQNTAMMSLLQIPIVYIVTASPLNLLCLLYRAAGTQNQDLSGVLGEATGILNVK